MKNKQEFSKIVHTYWQNQTGINTTFKNDSCYVFLDEDPLDKNYVKMF